MTNSQKVDASLSKMIETVKKEISILQKELEQLEKIKGMDESFKEWYMFGGGSGSPRGFFGGGEAPRGFVNEVDTMGLSENFNEGGSGGASMRGFYGSGGSSMRGFFGGAGARGFYLSFGESSGGGSSARGFIEFYGGAQHNGLKEDNSDKR